MILHKQGRVFSRDIVTISMNRKEEPHPHTTKRVRFSTNETLCSVDHEHFQIDLDYQIDLVETRNGPNLSTVATDERRSMLKSRRNNIQLDILKN